jgi:hypothetical protein
MHLLVSNHSTPIAIVEIDSSCAMIRIHATHFWKTALSTLAGFIEYGNGSDLQMDASPLSLLAFLGCKLRKKVNFSFACIESHANIQSRLNYPTFHRAKQQHQLHFRLENVELKKRGRLTPQSPRVLLNLII